MFSLQKIELMNLFKIMSDAYIKYVFDNYMIKTFFDRYSGLNDFFFFFQMQVGAYACIGSLFNMVLMIVFGSFLMILAKFSFGRWLILKVSHIYGKCSKVLSFSCSLLI